MHGCGNDYIYINCIDGFDFDPSLLSKKMSPRHFSVGADGVVLICKSDVADAKMRMFNADGSEGKMCGNAIRCVGKYLFEKGICKKTMLEVETLSGIKTLNLNVENEIVKSVTVDMGMASFAPDDVGMSEDGAEAKEIAILEKTYEFMPVSMGNPHCVVQINDVKNFEVSKIGPEFENHPFFTQRTNTEFFKVLTPESLEMRVWERGSGETYACGTGACALVAACVKQGICEPDTDIVVRLIGGNLTIRCDHDYKMMMTGPSELVYEGVYEYENSNE